MNSRGMVFYASQLIFRIIKNKGFGLKFDLIC